MSLDCQRYVFATFIFNFASSIFCVILGLTIYFGTDKIINDLKTMNGYENGLIILNNPKYIRDENTNEVIKLIDGI